MKRALLICLALLTVLCGNAFAQLPAQEGTTFTVTADTSVVLVRGSVTSQPTTIKSGVLTNCGYWVFGISADPTFSGQCRVAAATQPPPVTAVPMQSCWPLDASKYRLLPVPATVSSAKTHAAVWVDGCTNQARVQLFNAADLLNVVMNAPWAQGSDAINAWVKAQPVEARTPAEQVFVAGLVSQYAPPPVPVVVCKITRQSATVLDRQVYKANAAKTAVGSSLTGVRVAEGTPCGDALGTTSYRSVAGQKDTMGRVIAEGWAIGAVQ